METFNKQIQAQLAILVATGKLFRSAISGQEIWDIYLKSFKDGQDPIFRDPTSSTHNCNHCNNFIRRYGNIVAIDEDNNIITLFDFVGIDNFAGIAEEISQVIKGARIEQIFVESLADLKALPYESCSANQDVYRLGIDKNTKRYTQEEADLYGVVKANEIRIFHHMHVDMPAVFINKSKNSNESIMGPARQSRDVFARGLREIPTDTLELVIDLIKQGSLLNGDAYLSKVEVFARLSKEFHKVSADKQDNWLWKTAHGLAIASFRNEVIGTLCTDLAEGVDINIACQAWNKKVDPANFMKVTAPITEKQKKEAAQFAEENGYMESFNRRLATMKDILVPEILHINEGDSKNAVKPVTVFDKLKPTASTRHKRSEFDGVEEIHIDKFMSDILPSCTAVEVFLTNSHESSLVNLTTPESPDSKPIFKWDNNFSWTFNGNLAGKSQIKEAVKLAGGAVDGVLNFRLAWNDGPSMNDNSDLDAWATEPRGNRIGFSTDYRRGRTPGRSPFSGQLDVDNTNPNGKLAVENITWNDGSRMHDGIYTLTVHQYNARNSQGFKAEIEFGGQTYLYVYDRPVSQSQRIDVATVTLANGEFTIKHLIPESGVSSKDIYGLETNKFHRANLICLSPNYWGDNAVGNKHFLFMLEGCYTENSIRTFHNENLKSDLLENHRKVMDVLGSQCTVIGDKKQLAGLGFNATVRDELIVRLSGSHKRVVKIKF